MARPRKPSRLVRIPDREFWYVADGRKRYSTKTSDEEAAECFLAEYIAFKETPLDPNISKLLDIKRAFNEAADKAGLSWATPHTLKHSVISWLAEDKFTVDQISDMTATHPNTVRRIYRKFSPDYLEDVATSLAKTISFTNQFAKPAISKTK